MNCPICNQKKCICADNIDKFLESQKYKYSGCLIVRDLRKRQITYESFIMNVDSPLEAQGMVSLLKEEICKKLGDSERYLVFAKASNISLSPNNLDDYLKGWFQ